MYCHPYIWVFFSLFLWVFSPSKVLCILDGLTTGIQLNTTYTFTNFEFARGFVTFANGFDLPTNGTVVLNINQRVRGVIKLKGGTIILQGDLSLGPDLHFEGDGFIKTNNNTIFFTGGLHVEGKTRFLDNVYLDGTNTGKLTISLPGEFHFQQVQNLYLRNMKIYALAPTQRFFLPALGLNSFTLEHIDWEIFSGGGFNFVTNALTIKGDCLFRGIKSNFTVLSTTIIAPASSLEISYRTTFKTNNLNLVQQDSYLTLNDQTVATFLTSPITWGGLGNLKINGNPRITSTKGTITTNPGGNIHLTGGSNLSLQTTKLRVS